VASDRTSTIDAPHLAFDLRLNALVATDPPKGRVVAYRPDLSPIGFLDGVKEGPQPLEAPTGVAVRQGRAFVAEARRGRVVLYDLIGLGP
jgi:hypothetical protein